MKSPLFVIGVLVAFSACEPMPELDDFPPPTPVRQELVSTITCPGGTCLPRTATSLGTVLEESELGPVESELMNGLAKSGTHWFWINQSGIQRVPTSSGMTGTVDRSVKIPAAFADLGYDHFGDGDFYGDTLYVPLTGTGRKPVVLAYDHDLQLRGWAALGHGGGGFVAINPMDHRLYSASPFRKLIVYDVTNLRPAEIAPTSDMSAAGLGFIGTIELRPAWAHSDSWWSKAWVQGGAFSSNGVFYYVLDHSTEDESTFTGVYVFDVTPISEDVKPSELGVEGPPAMQPSLGGDTTHGIMMVSYDPIQDVLWQDVGRGDELEGITVYRGDDNKIHVLLQGLSNEVDDDDVTIYQWTTDEPIGRIPATPTPAVADDDWAEQFLRLGTDRASGTAAALLANALR